MWERERALIAHQRATRVTCVFPTLNEAAAIELALTAALPRGHRTVHNVDAIVVDGGSADDTPVRAAASGATVLTCTKGRGYVCCL